MGFPAEDEIIRKVRPDHPLRLCGRGKQVMAVYYRPCRKDLHG